MRLVSFDPFRALHLPGVQYLKPELMFGHRELLAVADWILFPEYWQVNLLAYGFRRRLFPSASTYHLGHDKIEMTRAFLALCPQHVPQTLIRPSTEAALDEVLEAFAYPFVAKEPRSSMGQGVFLIHNRGELLDYARRSAVLYVQEYLPIDRDLRVVYVGDRVVAAYWRKGTAGNFHHNVARGGQVDYEAIPEQAMALVAMVAAGLGIDHAGFDLACVGGHWYLLEFNVLFGNQALNEQGITLGPVILDYLQRNGIAAPSTCPMPPLCAS